LLNTLLLLVLLPNTVARIDFIGNRTFSDRTLRAAIYTKKGDEYNEINLIYETEKLVSYYRRFGFFATAAD